VSAQAGRATAAPEARLPYPPSADSPPSRLSQAGPLLAAAVALAACGGGGEVGAPAAPAAPAAATAPAPTAAPVPATAAALPSDLEIADLLYTDRQRVPPGFHVEAARQDDVYATIAHLRNTDLDAAATPPRELCAGDFATALQWSESVAAAQPVYGDLVGNASTARYHEFTRRLRSTPARTAIARVYRCEYLDRAGVDLRAPTGPAGRLGLAAWTADELQWLGEYLWTFTDDNNAGRTVLHSAPDGDRHALVLARLARAGVASDCDRVELWRVELRAERATGALTRSATLQRAFGARRVQGVVQACG
jgi:hypothetical protein